MKNTVLFLIDVLREKGGAEKNLTQLVYGLDPEKFKVIICCLKGGEVFEGLKKSGILAVTLNLKRVYGFDALRKANRLIRLIKKENVQVMLTYLEGSDFWGSIVARIAGVPVVISSRRDMGFNLKDRHKFTYRIINRLFDRIITVCDALKEVIIQREKVSPDKLATIYNGIKTEVKNNQTVKLKLKQSMDLEPTREIITMVANLAPVKGHKYLLNAAAKILKDGKSVQFLLVGAGKNGYEITLKDYVDKLGIKDNVTFTGFRSDISDLLSISDISVLSSTSEGLSNSILEYMAAANPVVATDVGGNKELVVQGETGFLVPAKDADALVEAISSLLFNKELRKKMGERGRSRVESFFTEEKMIRSFEQLFEELVISRR
ncbi:MAG: glycosyltransferase [Candidatus Omnitrophota bacterium]